jgi:large subunit ribosomal protein L21
MRAIIESGGKQYPVAPGDRLVVERLHAEPGDQVELGRVLLIEDEGKVEVGQPTVAGARVLAHVLEHDRGEKLVVFKFKAKVRYRRKTGHRQHRTVVQISEIVREGEDGPQKRRRKLPERAR